MVDSDSDTLVLSLTLPYREGMFCEYIVVSDIDSLPRKSHTPILGGDVIYVIYM